MLKSLKNKIKNLVKIARLVSVNDITDVKTGSVRFLSKRQRITIHNPYGITSNPPTNSLGMTFQINGRESTLMGVFDKPDERPVRSLVEYEVLIGNYKTKSHIIFKDDGSIVVQSNGNLEADVSGNITIVSSGPVNVTAPSIVANGNTSVNGNLDVSGTISGVTIAASGNLTVGALDMGTHVHSGGTIGSGTTGGPQ